ncbi:uncharacterized protein AC631_02546 [Debaryomyces fabryi]|uniref:Uncharacterized protein n=1 Tax=Debaryomyces fabryi TaxID=58627 RepID=A0A0V1PZG9_9ASCO|nr:uncharacterized protein AC631_02546 [Debaryomyces fabryi]KSA01672.1 hypothetical protein AC631_02546 [Debaryomyces fabryi]
MHTFSYRDDFDLFESAEDPCGLSVKKTDEFTLKIPPIYMQTPIQTFLDEDASIYFEYFCFKVSKIVTVGPDQCNHLVKTYIPLATSFEPIRYALASWGSVFLDSDSNFYKKYMKIATKKVLGLYNSSRRVEKETFYLLLCFFLIVMSIEINAGDTFYWRRFFILSQDLIEEYGGVEKVALDFQFSNEIKWIISNIQYHDALSSDSTIHRNKFICDYKKIMLHSRFFGGSNYGMDPFQGCIQPIYSILGEINNEAIKLEDQKKYIETLKSQLVGIKEIMIFKKDYCDTSTKVSESLMLKLNKCRPLETHIAVLAGDVKDLRLHTDFFELQRLSCILYVLMRIKKIKPRAPISQGYLIRALEKMESVCDSRLATCMGFPMLICGMTCCEEEERIIMRKNMSTILRNCPNGTFKIIVSLVEETWKMDPEGETFPNWGDLAHQKGWHICIS